jgi:hypothetical protein
MTRRALKLLSIAAIAVPLALPSVRPAEAGGVRVGYLNCKISSGFGFVFGSSRKVDCAFAPAEGPEQRYTGHLRKYGVDIGYVSSGVMVWAVVAPNWTLPPGALAGTYVGGTAEASLAVGVGANALIGGGNKSFALQPVSFQGVKGFNVAAGVGELSLDFVKPQ